MSETMLEKAARALYEFGMMADCPKWDQLEQRYRQDFCDMARAVLMAVRESGQEMRKVSDDMRIWEHGLWTDASSSETFTAMIDAILGQEPGA